MNKKQLWLLVILLFAGVALYAQVPKAINYQAVAYGEDGNALANKQITVKLAILQGGAEGAVNVSIPQGLAGNKVTVDGELGNHMEKLFFLGCIHTFD